MQAGFSYERWQRLAEIERWHFWFAGRRALVLRWLNECLASANLTNLRVYDLGCGTGTLLEQLTPRALRLVGSDLRPEGLQRLRANWPQVAIAQADATQLPWASDSFDVILLLDVLEHVDDRAALRELQRVLTPGGRLILTVPALPWLWSYRDEAAGHLRRYTRAELLTVLRESGFSVQKIRYFQFWLLPLLLLTRWLARRQPAWRETEDLPAPAVNRLLTWLTLSEVWLSRWVAWPCGSSLAALCQRPLETLPQRHSFKT